MRVFAMGAHPDDIEFMMAGTLWLLKRAGCSLHLMSLANGSCGTVELSAEQITAVRRREAAKAAELLGARLHESLANDLEIFFTDDLVRRVTAVIREIEPDVILLPSPEDYLEDHMNTSRIGAAAAFYRGLPNYHSLPPVASTSQDVALYHAMPYGLTDGLRRSVQAGLFVDISEVIDLKERMLACHESQKVFLDKTQGLDAYLKTMREMSRQVGRDTGRYAYAEGWRQHKHLGYSRTDTDPLADILKAYCLKVRQAAPA
jgi:LmbE family N-acetylglucosaminyl deacetylase